MECRTCPYQYIIKKRYYERKIFKHADTEDMIGGADQYKNANKTSVQCPKEGCDGNSAMTYSVQIRSADEPMTNFYQVGDKGAMIAGSWLIHWIVFDMPQRVEGLGRLGRVFWEDGGAEVYHIKGVN
jgi:hypothetical protein